jgi:hypothetical protein
MTLRKNQNPPKKKLDRTGKTFERSKRFSLSPHSVNKTINSAENGAPISG